jgi:DNA repair exonuclease SbcCD nuclease subunit
MTKIALIADSHFGIRNDSPVFHDYFRVSMKWFIDYIEKENIQHVVHLGDLFDRRKYLSYLTSAVCRESFLLPLNGMNISTHIISGNHDHYYTNTYEVNSLDEVVGNRYNNIKIYNTPQTITIDNLDILLIPWINQANREETINEIQNTKAQIVMGHLELNGFQMYRGVSSDHGEEIKTYDKFDLVFSGHYHHKSSVGNIHYIGAFAEYTWADFNDPRGFTVFDTESREFEFIKNPKSIYRMISYDDVKTPDIIQKIKSTDFSQYKNTYVKVLCVKRENTFAFDMLIDALYKAGPVDISVIEDITTFTDNQEDDVVDQAQDTTSILSSYIKGLTLPVDNDKMVNYMRSIYNDAISMEHTE